MILCMLGGTRVEDVGSRPCVLADRNLRSGRPLAPLSPVEKGLSEDVGNGDTRYIVECGLVIEEKRQGRQMSHEKIGVCAKAIGGGLPLVETRDGE